MAIAALAAEYNAIRDRLPSGSERTSQMTRIVSRMLSMLSGLSSDEFDPSPYLGSQDRGLRLAGYAFLYANPDPLRIQELTSAVVSEDKPFGQYWGIRAIHRQLQAHPDALDHNTRRDLDAFLARLTPGSDRARELRGALDEYDRRQA